MDLWVWLLGWFALKISVPASASSKIDDVLAEDGGLLNVLPLAVHLIFWNWCWTGLGLGLGGLGIGTGLDN